MKPTLLRVLHEPLANRARAFRNASSPHGTEAVMGLNRATD